ncbi:hypothetical protein [Antarctobacter heliothermus]|uniref:Uncharacterized protein n=1 Tax=Antarctobacter heliothermus TaxID=74033 RepID=A0A239LWB3_9RHOB|nr:hypothetical protein [Antarctobacter heliothermus]SNT34665.1 hypothetical protein SAMN04488078_11065 [Antarctobacter heliothermus]
MRRLLLSACLVASPLAAQTVQILPGYSDFRLPETQVVDRPMSLMMDWLLSFPESAEGGPQVDLSAKVEEGRLMIEFTDAGGGDDSVRAIQRRMEFLQTEGGRWQLVAYGFRQQCWRSGSDDWTDRPCP